MKPDVIIEVRFLRSDEGGRQNHIKGAAFYGCVFFVEGEAFDCRLLLGGRSLRLGQTYALPVKFLNPDIVMPKLSLGRPIRLWEGKDIAVGKVVRIGD